ncbi:MAG: ParB N-terminal domain-containing protein [Aeriscardovia sp.]|nr:ParB N-terminal domain-containing protein [Aeriscardovia sp.]
MESQMGRGLKALFPKMPGEAEQEKTVSLGKVARRRSTAPSPKRGVDAIFASSPRAIAWKSATVSINKIQIPDFIDRSREKEIEGLKDSISRVGLLFPILLRKQGESFELVAGYRRLLAFKNLGIKRIPSRVAPLTQRECLKIYRESNLV